MKTFGLENVKAFRDTGDIELAPITIFVGQNSCGKSSFIRFPVVLAQSYLDGTFPLSLHSDRSNLVDYGSYEDVLHNHKGKTFSCKFTYKNFDSYNNETLKTPFLDYLFDFYYYFNRAVSNDNVPKERRNRTSFFTDEVSEENIHLKITYSQDYENKTIVILSYIVMFNEDLAFSITRDTKGGYLFTQSKSILQGNVVDIHFSVDLALKNQSLNSIFEYGCLAQIIRSTIGVPDDTPLVSRLGDELKTPKSRREPLKKVLEGLNYNREDYDTIVKRCAAFLHSIQIKKMLDIAIRNEMEHLYYIGPFRQNPERIYRRDETVIQNVGVKGEYASKMLISSGNGADKIREAVSKWFIDAFNYELSIKHLGNEYFQIVLNDTKSKSDNNIMDVGYGVSQVLPIVSQIAKAIYEKRTIQFFHRDELFIIEQPELHLHPAAQSKLADLFANAISNNAAKNRKFLIETHSEHLIRALQVLIADPKCFLTSEMVKFYYVDKGPDGSVIKEMKTNEYGQFIERWPKGFFDEAHIMSRKLLDVVTERKNARENTND